MTTLLWFRQDLRLADNPALSAAITAGPVVPVFIHTPAEEGRWAPGGASRWWLHQSLSALRTELEKHGSRLILRAGASALEELQTLLRETGADRVVWNRRYEPAVVTRDRHIKGELRKHGVLAESFNAALLHEPWEIQTKTSSPYQVFTPYWRQCLALPDPPPPAAAPSRWDSPHRWPGSSTIEQLELLAKIDWAAGMRRAWQPGSGGARAKLTQFLKSALPNYDETRDRPGEAGTSGLSPHLHFGEIGPREVWHRFREHALAGGRHTTWRNARYLTEIGWREFGHHLLYHFPQTPEHALREKFQCFPWQSNPAHLAAWQRGTTGYPIVDAGMRELWHTGWMHNRVRMIVASFLVKDLLIAWQDGAAWFWDTLVDADLAGNTLGWQWSAGCGADAAPYFRIFNPISQGAKFDANGEYVRQWVPELASLDAQWIHEPWNAPANELAAAKIKLGKDYPVPIVDHAKARNAALAALASLRQR